MLTVTCRWRTKEQSFLVQGQVWNCSALAAHSAYEWRFEGRPTLDGTCRLEGYARWAESVRGLVARCLALAPVPESAASEGPWVFERWKQFSVEIALTSRAGTSKLLALATAMRGPETSQLQMGWQDKAGRRDLTGFIERTPARAEYPDPWALAEHTLRVGMWGRDQVPPLPELSVPVHHTEAGTPYVLAHEMPEPARSAFEERMAHSTRPLIPEAGTAFYAWDWTGFLQGQR